jgi:hypothetical protein
VHCSTEQDDSTFSKEWGHFEKASDGAWVRAESALTRIAELEQALRKYDSQSEDFYDYCTCPFNSRASQTAIGPQHEDYCPRYSTPQRNSEPK